MAEILIGQFEEQAHAEAAAGELRATGVAASDVEVFMLNAPGQHDSNPDGIGGDREIADPEAGSGHNGAVSGAALGGTAGAAIGAVAIPIAGPLAVMAGAAIGAYAGSLAGAVNTMGDPSKNNLPPVRPAGMRVAVRIGDGARRTLAQQVFTRRGARSIEEGQGQWPAGRGYDFDPKTIPHWLLPPPTM